MSNNGEAVGGSEPIHWADIEDDVREIFGDSFEFEIEDYGDYIEVHIKPGSAVEELEEKHSDLRIVPFNTCKMTIRQDD